MLSATRPPLSLFLILIFQKLVVHLNLNHSEDHHSCDTHHHCDGEKHIQQIDQRNVIYVVFQMVPPYLYPFVCKNCPPVRLGSRQPRRASTTPKARHTTAVTRNVGTYSDPSH